MKSINIVLILFMTLVSCKNETKEKENVNLTGTDSAKSFEKVEQLQWLVGHWTNSTQERQSHENWTRENDSTLKAHSFTIVDNDTVFAERVSIQQNGEELYFTAIAYDQNDNQPVAFKMIASEKGVFTFENPDHDFPTRISYSNPVKDSIHAWIEGSVEGQARKVDFYFKRD